jgi:putative ABC transport system substrate-binding protein
MRRRDFIALTVAAAAFPHVGSAQQSQTVRRAPGGRPWLIAALVNVTQAQSDIDWLGPFRKGLSALGYVGGRDYVIEARFTGGEAARNVPYARELVALAPDMVVVANGDVATAVYEVTKTIPILAGNLSPASFDSLIGKSLAHPAGNVTGISSDTRTLVGKHFDLALELVPALKTIGVLQYALASDATEQRALVTAAANARMLACVTADVNTIVDLAPAYQLLARSGAQVVVVGPSNLLSADRARTAAAAATAKLPAIYNAVDYVTAGGLICYGFDRGGAFERLAKYADRIMAGAKPADLPVEQTSNYLMAINLKTAKSLGLTIPPTVLFRADQVIE